MPANVGTEDEGLRNRRRPENRSNLEQQGSDEARITIPSRTASEVSPQDETTRKPAEAGRSTHRSSVEVNDFPLHIRLRLARLALRYREVSDDHDEELYRPDDFLKVIELNTLKEMDEAVAQEKLRESETSNKKINWKNRKILAKHSFKQNVTAVVICVASICCSIGLYIANEQEYISPPYDSLFLWAGLPAAGVIIWWIAAIAQFVVARWVKHTMNPKLLITKQLLLMLRPWLAFLLWGVGMAVTVSFTVKNDLLQNAFVAVAVVAALRFLRNFLKSFVIHKYIRHSNEKKLQELYKKEILARLMCANGEAQRLPLRAAVVEGASFQTFDNLRGELLAHPLRLPMRYVKSLSGEFLWLYSDSHVVEVGSKREAFLIADALWSNIAGRSETLAYASWKELVKGDAQLNYSTFSTFFGSVQQQAVEKGEFVTAFCDFIAARGRAALSITSQENLSEVVSKLTNAIFWLLMIFIVAAVFGVNIGAVALALSSLTLSLAFAFSVTLSRMIESFIYVFVRKPYDVGDRVQIDGEILLVKKINLLTTLFVTLENKHMEFTNVELSKMQIFNLQRVDSAVIILPFQIDFRTTREQLSQLRCGINKFIKENRHFWKRSIDIFITSAERCNTLNLNIWVRHRERWQSGREINRSRTEMILAISNIMTESKIMWKFPPFSQDLSNDKKLFTQHEPVGINEISRDSDLNPWNPSCQK